MEGSLKLSRFDSGEKEDPTLFKSLVGSLRYLTSTRPDIMYAVGVVCRFMEAPTSTHMKAAKRILRYLKGTLDFGLFYSSSNEFKLVEFCDSDFAGDVDDRKSTTGFVFFMGGCAFTWNSKKQVIVTLSTCEAEYVAATSYMCKATWLRRLLKEFNMKQEESTKIHIDNKSAQILAKNPERSKHIDIRYHFIRECIVKKEVKLVHVKTQYQVVNIFTKPLKFEDFRRLRARLVCLNSRDLGRQSSQQLDWKMKHKAIIHTRHNILLVDYCCTHHHMTSEYSMFKNLDKSYSRVKVGNRDFIEVNGSKRTVSMETPTLLQMFITINMKVRNFPLVWNYENIKAYLSSVDDSSLWHKIWHRIRSYTHQRLSIGESKSPFPLNHSSEIFKEAETSIYRSSWIHESGIFKWQWFQGQSTKDTEIVSTNDQKRGENGLTTASASVKPYNKEYMEEKKSTIAFFQKRKRAKRKREKKPKVTKSAVQCQEEEDIAKVSFFRIWGSHPNSSYSKSVACID
ncbi:hypothetical protein CR513_06716, partial [Mucuna pruriens]